MVFCLEERTEETDHQSVEEAIAEPGPAHEEEAEEEK